MTEPRDCAEKLAAVGSYHTPVVAPPPVTDGLAPDGIGCREASAASGTLDGVGALDPFGGPGDTAIALAKISAPRDLVLSAPLLSLEVHECLDLMMIGCTLLPLSIAALRRGGVCGSSALSRRR